MSKKNRKVTIKEEPDIPFEQTETLITSCRCPCILASVNVVASIAVIGLAAIAYVIAMTTRNWSASGYRMKMGLWDFCINQVHNNTWNCYPVNTGMSVVQPCAIITFLVYAYTCRTLQHI